MPNKILQISAGDVGVVLRISLTFSEFDPSGAAAVLFVAEPHGIGRIPLRAMSLVGSVASYTVVDGEFEAGYYPSQVRVTKDGVTVCSESFTLVVLP